MVCKINCAVITGIETKPVVVETDVCGGLPAFDMVGLLASDVRESRERVRTALKNSGFALPPRRITINLSPADIRKTGTYFDLPIAVSILSALGMLECSLEKKVFVGELSLNGDIVPVNGVLPIVLCALEQGMDSCFVPAGNVGECSFIKEMNIIGVESLNQLFIFLNQKEGIKNNSEKFLVQDTDEDRFQYDFKDIKGQAQAVRGAEIAAAGMHNILMSGPPGTGKSVIAKTIISILPDMKLEERIEISKIQSIAGILGSGLVRERPFRKPHYTATVAAMAGGGINPKPGEMTLAHGGVLYMDEFPEFSRSVIESLRQPLEDKEIVVSKSGGTYIFPADFMLLASMNPCRCGYYPDRNKCRCTEREVKKYIEKISGPIMDRIDLYVHMNPVSFYELNKEKSQKSSEEIRKRVFEAVNIQRDRYENEKINFNSGLSGQALEEYCHLNKKEKSLMEQIYDRFQLSVRGYEKILKTARTIADLKGKKYIGVSEISEAVSFRKQ